MSSPKEEIVEQQMNVADDSDDSDNETESAPQEDTSTQEKIRFTPEMTRNVFRLRLLVFLVLLMAAIAVSCVVYFITEGGETEEFESSYEGTASKVMAVFEGIVTEKLDAVASLSIAATAHSSDHDSEWPLFTLSFFQERAMAARKQSGTLFTSIVPMVKDEKREAWENYTVDDPEGWIQEGLEAQSQWDAMALGVSLPSYAASVHPGYIMYDDYYAGTVRDDGYGPFFPLWQTSPLLNGLVNFNLASLPQWYDEILTSMQKRVAVIGRTLTPEPGNALHGSYLTRFFATILSIKYGKNVDYEGDPFSYVFFPIFDSFDPDTREAVAVMFTAINWKVYFENLLPDNIVGVTLVLENGCDEPFTFIINGQDVTFVGEGDLHDHSYDDMKRSTSFAELTNFSDSATSLERNTYSFDSNNCPYNISVYPSDAFYDMHTTETPIVITSAVAGIFVFTVFIFMAFDRLVEYRQSILLRKATQTTEILSSIYPANIRDKLLAEHSTAADSKKSDASSEFLAPNHRLKSFLNQNDKDQGSLQMSMQPLADLFPNTTVMFADIAGFTAWSSVRDPAQVFILLQTLYGAFDQLAKSRKVFKVETIGDCYVAVAGLPKPQETHAVIMARFANDCLHRMAQLTKQLQVTLGPGTDELGLRLGLHSGPVTAGVLRGDRARFQLFGDTVNTAARMESTGLKNKIQCSEKTAALLIAAGKGQWVKPREDSVNAKGKGVLNTCWLHLKKTTPSLTSRSSAQNTLGSGGEGSEDVSTSSGISGELTPCQKEKQNEKRDEKHDRLVDWVVEIMLLYLQEILSMRKARTKKGAKPSQKDFKFIKQGTNLDEVVEVIALPKFDDHAVSDNRTQFRAQIEEVVVNQLKKLVKEISMTYRDNPFHNFQHACHVTMSVHKFLSRIVAPDLDVEEIQRAETNAKAFASHLHDYTHGINSDPLTRFAIIFSGLIHDSDHRGISNAQLAKENETLAELYQNKSLAEQRSLDICWDIFMSPEYKEFRNCLFGDEADFARFRQVCVNTVLATDIFDKELNDLRKKRWEKAFCLEKCDEQESAKPSIDSGLRATIVIEHIIQASDVSHTMQHWHVYRKWNECLFKELVKAYNEGRMGADPRTFWYKGELGFFDNYIIPLAKKLKNCGVFGVSSDECLDYALQNRHEWQVRGEEIVQELIAQVNEEEVGQDKEGAVTA